MVLDDKEIERSRKDGIAASRSKIKRDAAAQESRRKAFSKKAYEALKANDERAFAEQLRLANVLEGSEEWKRAWKYFRENSGRP
jgi:hypothetical protein